MIFPKTAFLFLMLLCTTVGLRAQNQHYVAFCARDGGNAGHAFVAVGYEDPGCGMTVYDGAWGKYPASSVSNAKTVTSIFGSVPGELRDDALTSVSKAFVVKATPEQYRKVIALIEKQRNQPSDFSLTNDDCLSFAIRAANVFRSDIVLPPRTWTYNLPEQYINRLIWVNRNLDAGN